MNNGAISVRYAQAVEQGVWRDNPDQRALASLLDDLALSLRRSREQHCGAWSASARWLKRTLFGAPAISAYAAHDGRGIYIYGSVGTGKTNLMDWFWQSMEGLPGTRLHFYAFMHEVHDRVAKYRASRADTNDIDPVSAVGQQLAAEYGLICLDEMFVQDIADAMILGRLFDAMLSAGAVVVCTSNCVLTELYAGGLHRSRFEPFLATLDRDLKSYELNAPLDYRSLAQSRSVRGYVDLTAEDAQASKRIASERINRQTWSQLTENISGAASSDVSNVGRADDSPSSDCDEIAGIALQKTCGAAAWVEFRGLCDGPYGASQYQRLIDRYDVLFISDVEVMNVDNRDLARRFVTFIDLAYEQRVWLALTAHAPLAELCKDTKLPELARMRSRIHALTAKR